MALGPAVGLAASPAPGPRLGSSSHLWVSSNNELNLLRVKTDCCPSWVEEVIPEIVR